MAIEDIKLTLVQDLDGVSEMMQWLGERRGFLAVDIEATGLQPFYDQIRLVQFGDGQRGFALSYRDWRGVIKQVIETYERPMVAHNLLYDSKMLKAEGITIPQRLAHDTMIMGHLKNPAFRMDLKGLAATYVDRRATAGQGLLKTAMSLGGWDWGSIPIEVPAYWMYSALDTCLTALLADKLYPEIEMKFREAYELELAVIHCLREAELAGLLVDEEYRQAAAMKLRAEIEWLRPQIPVQNPGSDDQIRTYLTSIGAPLFIRTESGKLSVDKDVLAWLAPNYPVAGLLRQYRQKTRTLGNYIEKFGEVGHGNGGLAFGGVVRASTRPVGARTGRMSVTDPPLQQLPRGRVVRDAIIPREGSCYVMADFSGMEMRALASLAQEPSMLAAYNRGEDLHNFVAASLYGADFTKPQRTVCKNAGFAKVYGAGVEKFAVTAGIDVGTARDFLDKYDEMFPGVRVFMERVTKTIYERAGGRTGNGWVELQDGRRLPVEAEEAYKGVNYRIQGGCAVTTKQKIVELDNAGLGQFFRLAVHDELLYEVPFELAADARDTLERVMPDRHNWPGVVLEIDSDIVSRWGEHYRDDFEAYIPTEEAPWLKAA